MADPNFEPTIAEIMREPLVRALMRADRVDALQLEARLRRLAERLRRRRGEEAADPEVAASRLRLVPPLPRAAAEHRCWG